MKNDIVRTCSAYEEEKGAYGVLVGKPQIKRPLGRPKCRREDYIKKDFKIYRWDGVHCIYLVQNRYQWQALMNTAVKFGAS
jgi:hypothetical protein